MSLYLARVRLAARVDPLFYGIVGLGVLTLMNIVVPLVFGRNFILSREAIALLALGTFFRFARGEPVHGDAHEPGPDAQARCREPVLGQHVVIRGRGSSSFDPASRRCLSGRLLGELFATAVTLAVTREQFRAAFRDFAMGMGVALGVLGGAIVLTFTTPVGEKPLVSLAALLACVAIYAVWAVRLRFASFKQAFPAKLMLLAFPVRRFDRAKAGPAPDIADNWRLPALALCRCY